MQKNPRIDWLQVVAIIATVAGMFYWQHDEIARLADKLDAFELRTSNMQFDHELRLHADSMRIVSVQDDLHFVKKYLNLQ